MSWWYCAILDVIVWCSWIAQNLVHRSWHRVFHLPLETFIHFLLGQLRHIVRRPDETPWPQRTLMPLCMHYKHTADEHLECQSSAHGHSMRFQEAWSSQIGFKWLCDLKYKYSVIINFWTLLWHLHELTNEGLKSMRERGWAAAQRCTNDLLHGQSHGRVRWKLSWRSFLGVASVIIRVSIS